MARRHTAQTVYAHICAVRISAHVCLCATAAHHEIKRTGERAARATTTSSNDNGFIKAPHIATLFSYAEDCLPPHKHQKEKE